MKSKPIKRLGPRSGASRQDGAFMSWVTDSEKFTIEAALAMYAPGNTVPLTDAERAALDGVDLVPLLRAGIEIGLADYPDRKAILKSMNDTLDATDLTSDALNRGQ
ncbi:MAG: hypothetical protein Q7K57_48595 [Burkholderiaceae bacterium]|nr:hypothetical protein [Burkholderiaceae bacterium]